MNNAFKTAAVALAAGLAIGTAHAADISKGKELVESHNCAACHGANGVIHHSAVPRAVAERTPPTKPSHVLFGLTVGAIRCRPTVLPHRYWKTSEPCTTITRNSSRFAPAGPPEPGGEPGAGVQEAGVPGGDGDGDPGGDEGPFARGQGDGGGGAQVGAGVVVAGVGGQREGGVEVLGGQVHGVSFGGGHLRCLSVGRLARGRGRPPGGGGSRRGGSGTRRARRSRWPCPHG